MAFANASQAGHSGLADRMVALVDAMVARRAANRLYRATVRELNALSAHGLDDLGLNRSMIRSVAAEAVYGNQARVSNARTRF